MTSLAGLQLVEVPAGLLVTGDTYPHHRRLRQLGGTWDKDMRGWLFPVDRRSALASLPGLAPLPKKEEAKKEETKAPRGGAGDVRIEPEGAGHFLVKGNTLALKKELKDAGGEWDRMLKAWRFRAAAQERIEVLLLTTQPAPKARQPRSWVYVLLLEEKKIYVGFTRRKEMERLEEHFNHEGAGWTRRYKPVAVLEWKPGTEEDEQKKTLEYMARYGWHCVRGGKYCRVEMSEPPEEIKALLAAQMPRPLSTT